MSPSSYAGGKSLSMTTIYIWPCVHVSSRRLNPGHLITYDILNLKIERVQIVLFAETEFINEPEARSG
jgi:hypothetical protein